jgi:hypothetical protein
VVSGNDRLTEASRQGCLRSQALCPTFSKELSCRVAMPRNDEAGKCNEIQNVRQNGTRRTVE